MATGRELKRFEGHTDKVWDIDLSPDGRFVVSGSHDGTARRWDLETGQSQVLLDVSPQAVRSVAFSPDGRTVLAGLGKGDSPNPNYDLRLLEAITGREVHRLAGHKEVVGDIEFHPGGELALSGAGDTTLILWDVETGREIHRFTGHIGTIKSVAFNADGSLVASASHSKNVLIWETATGNQLRRFPEHGGTVLDLIFTPAGNTLLAAAVEEDILEWRIDETQAELLDWIVANRYLPEPTCAQRVQYHLEPLCEQVR